MAATGLAVAVLEGLKTMRATPGSAFDLGTPLRALVAPASGGNWIATTGVIVVAGGFALFAAAVAAARRGTFASEADRLERLALPGRRDHRRVERHRTRDGDQDRASRRRRRAARPHGKTPWRKPRPRFAARGAPAVVPCDVRDRDAVLAALREVEIALGPVDLLVANAGVGLPVSARRWDGRRVAEVFAVNVAGPAHAIEAVLPGMLERGTGRIVGIADLAGWRAFAGHGAYGGSKAALMLLLESLRLELLSTGVGVTTICPGFIRTPMSASNRFKMPFLLEPDDAARRIVNAIAAGRRMHAFPWPLAMAVRLARLLPAAAWDRIAGTRRR